MTVVLLTYDSIIVGAVSDCSFTDILTVKLLEQSVTVVLLTY